MPLRLSPTWISQVSSVVLTGLSTATNAAIAATDTILAALGKLQAQLANYLPLTGGTVTGSIITTVSGSPGAIRIVAGGYGLAFYSDGSGFYILLTNSGDANGGFNALRPFNITLGSGFVTMGAGASVTGGLFADNLATSGLFTAQGGVLEKAIRMSAVAATIDLNSANYFAKTISSATTFTLGNVPASGTVASFIMELTNGGSNPITWWSNLRWAGGSAPALTVSGTDILQFFTIDSGANWRGIMLSKASA